MKKRFAIAADAALLLAKNAAEVPDSHALVAPTLLRSQVLARLYSAVRNGDLDKREADDQLDYLRGLRIRLLGDRVLQRYAWNIARQQTRMDEYLLCRIHRRRAAPSGRIGYSGP